MCNFRSLLQVAEHAKLIRGRRCDNVDVIGNCEWPTCGLADFVYTDILIASHESQLCESAAGLSTPKSVITTCGPAPVMARRARSPCPLKKPALVQNPASRRSFAVIASVPQNLFSVESNFWRATGTRQTRLWFAVAADDGGVKIAKAIDLRRAEKADIDPARLQPVGKNFR